MSFAHLFLNIPKDVRAKTCAFKFGKVAASALIATALTGFILPKLNHKITNWSKAKAGEEANNIQMSPCLKKFLP